MRLLIGALLSLLVAAAIGLGSTWLALTRGVAFGAVTLGAWTAYPRGGSAEIDPYARAAVSRSGLLPVGLGDGVAFVARGDDKGRPLDGRCEVRIAGTTPQARFFTLTLYRPDGALIANSLGRYGFTSQELVRKSDGTFEIVVAPRARPGNWLPTGGVERYLLVLRIYDTPVGIATRAEREAPMPSVTASEICS
ncbi:DUF1214 domain-containing protein [Rhodoplanes roseus]|uniref:DUF1214 domain-containing protein n=1 Tax=Rhodoplanes roseus TaxID=29409 RepID=A0A327KBC0_9BRAD|nr:DUF1214 domain-containing protein [Rhodoplanes roseus]RAI34945.1 hypothetical protein CH341_31165 [Rhodoplanes roseus]